MIRKEENKEISLVYLMDIAYEDADYLRDSFKAEDIFYLDREAGKQAVKLLEEALNKNYNANNYEAQVIGVKIDGTKKVYAFAWSNNNVFFTPIQHPKDPVKQFFSPMVLDGGAAYIDAIIDLKSGTVQLIPHGES